jgi:hypothetical protein
MITIVIRASFSSDEASRKNEVNKPKTRNSDTAVFRMFALALLAGFVVDGAA